MLKSIELGNGLTAAYRSGAQQTEILVFKNDSGLVGSFTLKPQDLEKEPVKRFLDAAFWSSWYESIGEEICTR